VRRPFASVPRFVVARGVATIATIAMFATFAPAAARADEVLDTGVGRLAPGEWRVGLWRVNYGLPGRFKDLQLGTGTLPYLAWAFGVPTLNLEAKYEPWRRGPWRTSLGAGVTWLRYAADGDDTKASLHIIPLEARAQWQRKRWAVHSGLTANISTNSTTIDVDDFEASAGAIGTTVYWPMGVTWRAGKHLSLIAERRWYLYQAFGVTGETEIDDRTKVLVYGKVGVNGKGMLTLDALWHWRHLGVKLGLSIGDVEVPVLRIVIPAARVLPRLDVYVRF